MELKIGDRWFVVTTDPILDETRTLVGAVHNIRDITDRVKAGVALQESEEKFRTLAESCPFAIAIYQDDYWVYTNPAGEQISGYSADELYTMHYWDFVAPGFQPFVKESGRKRQTRESALTSYDFEIITKDGGRKWVALSGSPITFQGKPAGLITVIDITERKRAEEALKKSEERFHNVIDAADEFVFEIDTNGIFTFVSNRVRDLVGYDPEELVGKMPFSIMVSPDDIDRVGAIFAEHVRQKRPYLRMNHTCLSKDGRTRILTITALPFFDSAGKIKGYQGVVEDITDRKNADEALQQANKKLNLLSSITRHDILNGVSVLEGYIDLAGDEVQSPGMQEYIGYLDKAAKTIRHQIEFTREYQEIGVKEARWQNVGETVKKAGSVFKMENVTLTITCVNIEIFADPLLQKVFHNLFDNAFRYAAPFTTITVSCTETEDGLYVVFADDGVGITEDVRKHLFERGFGKNTGLGLFLSREILAITGITIAENGEAGKGARFVMTVPKSKFRFTGEEEHKA